FRLIVDRRLSVGEDFETFEGELREATHGIDHELELSRLCLPTLADRGGHTLAVGREALQKTHGAPPLQFSQGRQALSIFAERTHDLCNLGPGSVGQPHKANESASIEAMVGATQALHALIEAI